MPAGFNQLKVLVLSDAAFPISTTGFAIPCRVAIDKFLDMGWQVHHLARGMKPSSELPPEWKSKPIKCFRPERDFSGWEDAARMIKTERMHEPYDLVFIEADAGSIHGWLKHFVNYIVSGETKIIVHMPTEGGPLRGEGANSITTLAVLGGVISTYTQYSADIVKEAVRFYTARDSEKFTYDVYPVGLGADHYDFTPLPEQRAELREYYGWSNRKVIMANARNAGRKYLPTLMKAVKLLSETHPEVLLYLHTVPFEGYSLGGWNLPEVAYEIFGLQAANYVHYNDMFLDGTNGVPFAQLHRLYAASDVFVNCSGAEGWGLPSTEAALCGLPVFQTKYSGGWEVVQDFAVALEPTTFDTQSNGTELAIVQPEEIAEQIDYNYFDAESVDVDARIQRGIEVCKGYTWKTLRDALPGLIDKAMP